MRFLNQHSINFIYSCSLLIVFLFKSKSKFSLYFENMTFETIRVSVCERERRTCTHNTYTHTHTQREKETE